MKNRRVLIVNGRGSLCCLLLLNGGHMVTSFDCASSM